MKLTGNATHYSQKAFEVHHNGSRKGMSCVGQSTGPQSLTEAMSELMFDYLGPALPHVDWACELNTQAGHSLTGWCLRPIWDWDSK